MVFAINRSLAAPGDVVDAGSRVGGMRRGVAKSWVPQSSTTCFVYCFSFFPIHRSVLQQ